jgi:hypothetical protein
MTPIAVPSAAANAFGQFWTEVPTILNVGFTGFAFLLMYLAYGLLQDATKADVPNPLNVKIIRTFMLISLVMTILASGSETYKQWIAYKQFRKAASLVIFVSPGEMPDADTKLSIVSSLENSPIDLSTPAHLSIVDGESVTLKLDNLTERVRTLEEDVRVEKRAMELAQNTASAALTKPTAQNSDQGIGNVKNY